MSALRSVRLAVALWFTLAFVVWNVWFDHALVLAGRRYTYAAVLAARQSGPYLRIDDWMRPAIAQAARSASLAALVILATGLVAIYLASRQARAIAREESPCNRSPIR
jgi:hypothetical protein